MRTLLLLVLVSFFIVPTYATKIAHKPLSELVKESDHVFIVKIEKVIMVDGNGKEIKDLKARTGPGSRNEIQLHAKITKNGALKSSHKKLPKKFYVAFWKAWHRSLGSCKDLEGKTWIFLLKGKKYQRVYPGGFMRNLKEKEKILQLIQNGKKAQKNTKKS